MVVSWLRKKIFGSKNMRELNKLRPIVLEINKKELEFQSLTDDELKAKTEEFKKRLKNNETLEDIKVEAFAVVKNACRRLCGKSWKVCDYDIEWNMVPFDVQLLGGLSLHYGKISEMATGEGKTLVATMPLYLNALTGENVQLVTVNEYLAQRDSEWMGGVYNFLGLTSGYITNNMSHYEKKEMYHRDIIYGTASEFGFDYLRDNGMAVSKEYQVQRSHFYCIIDEVDSILIDEARTPLIISGAVDVSTHKYDKLKSRVSDLVRKQLDLCAEYMAKAEKLLKEDINSEEGALLLYKVSIGTPKNRKFVKLMEQPKFKKVYERADSIMNTDLKKEENAAIKEELYYVIDEKSHNVNITEKGRDEISYSEDKDEFVVPDIVSFYQEIDARDDINEAEKLKTREEFQIAYEEKMEKIHNISQLLKAYSLFEKDVEYVVQENKVMIVDEHTGRLQPGRRFSDGLHQALEAKENVKIEKETQTLASITIQNYFRMYKKLAGMTGTAETEADEFFQIYKMEVLVMPTNVPCVRQDKNDIIYKTKREKYNAIIDDVEAKFKEGRPILVGTVSVEVSEVLSRLMKRRKIPHQVLNAKQHQKESEIVSKAGHPGKVTIATNMAGRGTDIKLGQGVNQVGGLHIIGSERHESRRIDRQLRGRAGRQGDCGSSVFFISLEDDLMRLFGSDRIVNVMEKLGMEEGQELESPFLTKAIERAQKKVEERNFSIRKHTLEFDDVMNKQRTILYQNRNMILNAKSLKNFVVERIEAVIETNIFSYVDGKDIDFDSIKNWFLNKWPIIGKFKDLSEYKTPEEIIDYLKNLILKLYEQKEKYEGHDNIRAMERYICLDVVDRLWKEHLRIMDDVRESSYLLAYGQRDPLQEYKKSAYEAFSDFMSRVEDEITTEIFRLTSIAPHEVHKVEGSDLNFQHDIIDDYSGKTALSMSNGSNEQKIQPKTPYIKSEPEVGRNDPCICGSGKKYKKCCGNK